MFPNHQSVKISEPDQLQPKKHMTKIIQAGQTSTLLDSSPQYWLKCTSGYLPQLGDPANFHPFDHEDIAFMIEVGAMWGYKLAWLEEISRFVTEAFVTRAFSQMHY